MHKHRRTHSNWSARSAATQGARRPMAGGSGVIARRWPVISCRVCSCCCCRLGSLKQIALNKRLINSTKHTLRSTEWARRVDNMADAADMCVTCMCARGRGKARWLACARVCVGEQAVCNACLFMHAGKRGRVKGELWRILSIQPSLLHANVNCQLLLI